jgi:hypothetical protein
MTSAYFREIYLMFAIDRLCEMRRLTWLNVSIGHRCGLRLPLAFDFSRRTLRLWEGVVALLGVAILT